MLALTLNRGAITGLPGDVRFRLNQAGRGPGGVP